MKKGWWTATVPFVTTFLRRNYHGDPSLDTTITISTTRNEVLLDQPVDLNNTNNNNTTSTHLLKSLENDDTTQDASVRIVFRNHSNETLLLCWMTHKGQPSHFYLLHPTTAGHHATSKKSSFPLTNDHVENTRVGHTFCLAQAQDLEQCRRDQSLEKATIVAAYRPLTTLPHLVHIEHEPEDKERISCFCPPSQKKPSLRGGRKHRPAWKVHTQPFRVDKRLVDTRKIGYQFTTLCVDNWPVYLQEKWTEAKSKDSCQKLFEEDLNAAIHCLPLHARTHLQQHCPIWINEAFCYGPVSCPINGKGACFHPDVEWLEEQKMHTSKQGCIEFYNMEGYQRDRQFWGPGGLILHELCHAYHHKMIPKGYDNKEIEECWKQAMKEGLYDEVEVHGPQGPMARAYACTNHMEYFAELSVAFLSPDIQQEFNKWYPFNRKQLQQHDPRAYKLLEKVWKGLN